MGLFSLKVKININLLLELKILEPRGKLVCTFPEISVKTFTFGYNILKFNKVMQRERGEGCPPIGKCMVYMTEVKGKTPSESFYLYLSHITLCRFI